MLYLHIPARHPPSFPELELPTLMQSAALMAVGLLYQGSAHRLTTEILLVNASASLQTYNVSLKCYFQ
jgi:anaphase-promoting complex subunit 1